MKGRAVTFLLLVIPAATAAALHPGTLGYKQFCAVVHMDSRVVSKLKEPSPTTNETDEGE